MTQASPSTNSQAFGTSFAPIVTSPERMDLEWFRSVLGGAGLLAESDLSSVKLEPVGGGVIARIVRATLTYAGPTSAPASVVVKYPTDDPGSFGLAQAMGMYELETRFYRDVAPLVPNMGLAKCYLAQLADDATNFTPVLEDLGGTAVAGDVLKAASADECSRALGELVAFQAPLWNSPKVAELEWLADPRRTIGVFDALPAGTERYAAQGTSPSNNEHTAFGIAPIPIWRHAPSSISVAIRRATARSTSVGAECGSSGRGWPPPSMT